MNVCNKDIDVINVLNQDEILDNFSLYDIWHTFAQK